MTIHCKRCHKKITTRAGNQRYCTTCSNIINLTYKTSERCKKRNFKPDNGNSNWLEKHLKGKNQWEPSELPEAIIRRVRA